MRCVITGGISWARLIANSFRHALSHVVAAAPYSTNGNTMSFQFTASEISLLCHTPAFPCPTRCNIRVNRHEACQWRSSLRRHSLPASTLTLKLTSSRLTTSHALESLAQNHAIDMRSSITGKILGTIPEIDGSSSQPHLLASTAVARYGLLDRLSHDESTAIRL